MLRVRSVLKFPDKVGRKLLQLVDNDYLKNKLAKRSGECKRCGDCCGNCRFLDKKTMLCKVYDNRPWLCYKEFPLDKLDQKIWQVKNCGFSFKE
jgi:hypothetical protein